MIAIARAPGIGEMHLVDRSRSDSSIQASLSFFLPAYQGGDNSPTADRFSRSHQPFSREGGRE